MPKTVRIHEYGGPEVLPIEGFPLGAPRSGEDHQEAARAMELRATCGVSVLIP